jgi:predicted  nucleic acid-binding Zn-ribbon protein
MKPETGKSMSRTMISMTYDSYRVSSLHSDLDAEYAARKEKRNKDLEDLKRREEELNATRKVTESHMDQLKGACGQFRNEAAAHRMELAKIGRDLGENNPSKV